MKIKMLSERYKCAQLKPIEVVLMNRGFKQEDIYTFLNLTDSAINSPLAFGETDLKKGATILIDTISKNQKAVILVDVDTDGFTSSAIFINYLYQLFPCWITNNLDIYLHEKKVHGLKDCIEHFLEEPYDLIICPDSASSDYEEHKRLFEKNKKILILDHHEAKYKNDECAVVINNQLCDYPNKALSGAGVTWQFCRYLDSLLGCDFSNEYLDLVALGLIADIMNLKEPETQYLVQKGLKNIKNPFIYYMTEKNAYSLGKEITPFGVAFYIAPYVNAITRSGTREEQLIVFKSMLNHWAYKEVPSTKRGHKEGDMETIVGQALRIVTNVKSRQGKLQTAGQELIEDRIEKNDLLDNHKILMIQMEENELGNGLAGLIANKLMSKYQRPVCVLTRCSDDVLRGSARGYEPGGCSNFKKVCENSGEIEFAAGHPNAFGVGVPLSQLDDFFEKTDILLKDISTEPSYLCDFAFDGTNLNEDILMEIGDYERLWGKGLEKPQIYIKGLKLSRSQIRLLKSDTLRIDAPIPIIKFWAKEEYEKLTESENIEVDIVATASLNEFNGNISAQLHLVDFEIVNSMKYIF